MHLNLWTHLRFVAFLLAATCPAISSAQCPSDDAFEPNDDCASAQPGMPVVGIQGLVVTDLSNDYWTFAIAAGEGIRVTMTTDALQADVDMTLYDDAACGNPVAGASTGSAVESFSYVNETGAPQSLTLYVWMFSGTCGDYSLDVDFLIDPCTTGSEDSLEPNDDCTTAVVPPSNPQTGLFLTTSDPDFYAFSIPPETEFRARVLYDAAFGNIRLRLTRPSDCITPLASANTVASDVELLWTNNSSVTESVALEVSMDGGGFFTCYDDYTLEWFTSPGACTPFPPDSFEPNEACATPTTLGAGFYSDLTVRKTGFDEDWYEVAVPNGFTLDATAQFAQALGDIDLELFLGCGGPLVDEGTTISDNENVLYTNFTGVTQTLYLHAFVWPGDPNECASYNLNLGVQPLGTNFVPFCFGDGSGTPCPCGNNSSPGHLGGCAHLAGDGAILIPSGSASVASDDLSFNISSATPVTFGLLLSGDNLLPQLGSCAGCGIQAFDGLRCAGGALRRHGTRNIAGTGATINAWGAAGGNPLVASSGFVAGQTRRFFAFFRTNFGTGCGSGQNSSNGVELTFIP